MRRKYSRYEENENDIEKFDHSQYVEVVYETTIDNDGAVSKVKQLVPMDHPCKGLNADHFRLDVISENNPEFLNNQSFKIDSPLDAADSLNSLNECLK